MYRDDSDLRPLGIGGVVAHAQNNLEKLLLRKRQVLDFMASTHRMKSSSLSAPAQVFKSLYSAAEAWNWSSTSNLIERSKVKLQTTLLLSVF